MLDQRAREIAINLAQEANEIILHYFQRGATVEWKADGSPVTQADIEINRLVMERIAEEFPAHGFIGEELGERATTSDDIWLCDPIDGTRPFTIGYPVSTFTLALVHKGEPVLGVISYPARNWLFVGEAGKGTMLNDEPLRVSEADTLRGGVVDLLCPSRHRYWVPGLYDAIDDAGGVPFCYNSASVAAAFVARGAIIGSVWSGATPWDAAACKVIVEEAGGRFTDLEGNEQRYDRPVRGSIASNGHMHEELVTLVRTCGIRQGRTAGPGDPLIPHR
jgi:histidinol-phosphatase